MFRNMFDTFASRELSFESHILHQILRLLPVGFAHISSAAKNIVGKLIKFPSN